MMNHSGKYDVIIVGGGAAGIIAAGRAAQLGSKVLLIEKMTSLGRKLLLTGKGRCNITHDSQISDYYKNIFPNSRFLKHAFSAFFKNDIIAILNQNGVETITERGNRVFPISNKASEVLQALKKWMGEKNIEIILQCRVSELIINNGYIRGVKTILKTKSQVFNANNVIICTGGKSYPGTGSNGDGYKLAQSVGHSISRLRPALVPLLTKDSFASKLQGLGLKNVKATVWVDQKKEAEGFGEVMFTHFGLSGPVILTLSRHVVDSLDSGSKVEISIDLKPAIDNKKLDKRLVRDLNTNGKKQLENIFKQWLPSKLIAVFLEKLSLDGQKQGHQINAEERKKILQLMKNFRFSIYGHTGYKDAIITAGRIPTLEINSKTIESKLVKGLFFAGEIIDLDANTGGFNLQIAFSTAYLAAESISLSK